MNFDQAFDILLRHDGGYSDHPADPGGATRFGMLWPLLWWRLLW